MAKLKIACHVYTWSSLTQSHWEPVFRQIAEAGYDGLEGLFCDSSEALVEMASAARKWGLEIVMVSARSPHQVIRYNAALGCPACEIWEGMPGFFGEPGMSKEQRFALAAKFFESLLAEAARYRIKLCHHIHWMSFVETAEDVDLMMKLMPDMGILLDTGHLLATGGDPMEILHKYGDKVVHVHLKEFNQGTDDWDYRKANRTSEENHFALVTEGNTGFDAKAFLQELDNIGYDKWVSLELDPQPGLMKKGSPRELILKNRKNLCLIGY